MKLKKSLKENRTLVEEVLPLNKSFDVIGRELTISNVSAYLMFIDGFAKDDIMIWIIESLQRLNEVNFDINNINDLIKTHIPYIEIDEFEDLDVLKKSVLSGAIGLILDGFNKGIIIDARSYPARGPEEPTLERVTRGARDGFVETIVFNTALIRRRIRDDNLIFEMKTVGTKSKTDVAIGYIDGAVDEKLLERLKKEIDEINVEALIMAEKSLEELLIKKKWYNPLPQVKFTERPDVVSAHLLEGHIAIIVDTSPSVILLPTTIFHFSQHAEDYYQNPMVGTYIRWVRFFSMILAIFLTPSWLLLVYNNKLLPNWISFIGPNNVGKIPLFIQFLILEFGFDMLRIASIHTPDSLTTSLGIIGGLILSEFAIKVGWFIPETILYMAVVAIGTFATPSIEFAMAIRIFRLILLITTGLFKNIGFIFGILIVLSIIFSTKSFGDKKYTWPLYPFDSKALSNLLFRKPIVEIKRNNQLKNKKR